MTVLKIRLGAKCNQNCSFCNSNKTDNYEFNEKIIPYIKYTIPEFETLTYGGGEPFLYWDYIKKFIEAFPTKFHHIVTNGSLINEEILEYAKHYRMRIGISINKFMNISDHTYKLISQIPILGAARLYTGRETFDELDEMLEEFDRKVNRRICADYNLLHTTSNIPGYYYTQEMIDHYITEMDKRVVRAILFTKNGLVSKYNHMLYNLITLNRQSSYITFLKPKSCDSYTFTSVSLDGRHMPCSYIMDYSNSIEDIYDVKTPTNKVECLKCELLGKCQSCYKSINNTECIMLKTAIKNALDRFKEYDMTPDEFVYKLKSGNKPWFTSFDYKTDD